VSLIFIDLAVIYPLFCSRRLPDRRARSHPIGVKTGPGLGP